MIAKVYDPHMPKATISYVAVKNYDTPFLSLEELIEDWSGLETVQWDVPRKDMLLDVPGFYIPVTEIESVYGPTDKPNTRANTYQRVRNFLLRHGFSTREFSMRWLPDPECSVQTLWIFKIKY